MLGLPVALAVPSDFTRVLHCQSVAVSAAPRLTSSCDSLSVGALARPPLYLSDSLRVRLRHSVTISGGVFRPSGDCQKVAPLHPAFLRLLPTASLKLSSALRDGLPCAYPS